MKKNIIDFFSYSFSQLFTLFISILISAVWARYATVEEYGVYGLLLSFVSIVGIFSFPGLTISMQLSSANGKNGNLHIAVMQKIKYSFIGSSVLLFIAAYYFFMKDNILLSNLLCLVAFFYPFYSLNSLWENWLTGIKKVKKLAFLFILLSLINLVSIVVGLIFLHSVILSVFLLFISISLFNLVVIKVYTLEDKKNTDIDEEILNYGYAYSGAVVISMLVGLDKFIISEYITLADVAIYSVSMLFVSKIKILFITLNKLMAPTILKTKDIVSSWNYIKYKLVYIGLLFIMVAIVGFVWIDDLIVFIFTAKYEEAGVYAKWLWLVVALTRPFYYLNYILKAQKKLKFLYITEMLNSMGKLLLFLVLLPIYSLWGMVYATIMINVLVSFVTVVGFFYYYKREISNA